MVEIEDVSFEMVISFNLERKNRQRVKHEVNALKLMEFEKLREFTKELSSN